MSEPTPASSSSRPAKAILRAFFPLWWKYRRTLLLAYLSSLLAVAMLILAPWPLKFIIDYVLSGQPLPVPIGTFVANWSRPWLVMALAVAAAVIGVAGAGFSSLEKRLDARVRERMAMELRNRLVTHVQTLSFIGTTQSRSGEIVLRIVDDVHQFVRLLTKTIPMVVQHITTLLAVFFVMFAMEPRLGLLGLGLVAILCIIIRWHSKELRKAAQCKRRDEGAVAGFTQELVRGLPTIQALGAELAISQRFDEVNRYGLKAGVRETWVAVAMERNVQIANAFAVALVVGCGGLLVLKGALSLGGLTVCMAYMAQLLKPVDKINDLATNMARGLVRGERILALLARQPAVQDREQAAVIQRARGLIELKSVHFAYPASEHGKPPTAILREVDLRLEPDTLTVLIGPSGSGKSTLLSLLLRLTDPTAGEIRLDGMAYREIRLRNLRDQFAAMLQHTHLFTGTLRASLQPFDRELSDHALWQMLAEVALDHYVARLPGQLDAVLGEDGMNFSGGQRARLSLARALLLDRPILLLDEPLANVDANSQTIILDTLDRFRIGRTCLAVTHQPELAERADRVLRLEHQRLTEVRSHASMNVVTLKGSAS